MKKLSLIITVLFFVTVGSAQSYKNAIGVRFNDYYAGFTYKKFVSEENALDFTLNSEFNNGFGLTALYEIHKPTGFAPNLFWYYGAGGHISLWSGEYHNAFENSTKNYAQIGFGVDGVVGLEYSVGTIPFAFSIDYIPSFSIITTTKPGNLPDGADWDGFDTGFGFRNWTFGVKYTFGGTGKSESDTEEK